MGKRRGNGRFQVGPFWLWYRADRDDWNICWLVGRTTRRLSLGIAGGTRDHPPAEAHAALAKHFAEHGRPTYKDARPDEVPMADLTRMWLKNHVQDLAASDRYAYSILALERFYQHKRSLGTMPEPFTVDCVRSWFVREFVSFREAEGVSKPTISRDVAALRGPISWGLEEGILASAPKVKAIKGAQKSRTLVYLPEQIAAILEAAASRPDRAHILLYIMIAMSTHGRGQAILELNASTQVTETFIDFNPPGRVQTTKKRPIVPIAPTLAPWLAGRTGCVIRYESEPREDGTTFTRDYLKDIGNAFEATLLDAGASNPDLGLRQPVLDKDGKQVILPPRFKLGETEGRAAWKGVGSPNTLRHSLHTYLSAIGVPIPQINTAAGHATMAGIGSKYDHLRPEYLKEFIEGVEQFWREVDAFTTVHRRT